jgi:pimeloyl-ACP methyl ester carboxylesterase
MATPLQPNGNPVQVGNVTLRTPGLAGQVRVLVPQDLQTRAATQSTDAFEQALARAGILPQQTIELSATAEVGGVRSVGGIGGIGAGGARSTSHGEPAIEVTVPDAGEGWGQFVLAADESGVVTWNFSVDAANRREITRGAATRTYVIPRYVATPAATPATRGLLGAIGKKILKVLAFRLVKTVGGEIGDYFVERWETANRPHRFRSFLPASYGEANVPDLVPAEWNALGAGRALLLLHGTASRTDVGFGGLAAETVAALHEHYGGRVFAFDHPTLSRDPRQNVDWFFHNIPDGTRLEVDVLCHSRGGLVARMLAERENEFSLGSRGLNVRRLVFVAVPNAGTILADADYMGDFLDAYTNLLNFLPDNGVSEVFEALVEIGKQAALGTLDGLGGLQSMRPDGPFLAALNAALQAGAAPSDTKRYFALSSNYEPTEPGFKAWSINRLLDKVFKKAENDLVVPTQGVYDKNGSALFPIPLEDRRLFDKADGIAHTRFFGDRRVQDQILTWLTMA